MIWTLLILVLVAIALAFGAPFLDFLAPGDEIWLVNTIDKNHPEIMATGAGTLWFQWQSWLYVALFVLVLVILGSVTSAFINKLADHEITEHKAELKKEIAEYKRLQCEFKEKTTKEIERNLASEQARIDSRYNEVSEERANAYRLKLDAAEFNKQTNIANKGQQRENRSKLAQRDRLSEQKKLLSEYLEQSGWKFSDGELITYSSLLKLAKQSKN